MISATNRPGIAYITADAGAPVLTDVQSGLNIMADAKYQFNAGKLIFDKSAICEDFFDLSTKIAGEILQKYVNYHMEIAIVGDFSNYKSKSLHDFIYECNQGGPICFTDSLEAALDKLA